jgi:hypothetical protein
VFEKAPEQPYAVTARVESQANVVFKSFDDLRAESGWRRHRLPLTGGGWGDTT